MRFLFILLGAELFLGTLLSLHLIQEAWFFLPLYVLATYHLYRVNYSEGFFVVFNKKDEREEQAKIRLGPAEIGPKDEGDRKEEKFIALFDWKRKTIRNVLSWLIFGGSIYLYFYRLKMEISLASVMAGVTALFVMRSISVGHLLLPLIINLFLVLMNIPEYRPVEQSLAFIYGVFFVVILSLIYPSEDRLGKKLHEWKSGRWMDIARAVFILMVTMAVSLLFLPEKFEKDPPVADETIQVHQKELRKLESSIRGMERMGLMKRPDLQQKARYLARDIEKFSREDDRPKDEWVKLKGSFDKIQEEVTEAKKVSSQTRLSPELLEKMATDLRQRSRAEIDPLLQERMENLLKRMENYQGIGGKELIGEYQEMKFGNKGYYREETEFHESSSLHPDNATSLLEMKRAVEKKKEITEKLRKNIEELKGSPDESLLSVNRAIKDELEAVDSLSSEEKSVIHKELQNTKRALDELAARTKNPELLDKIAALTRENQQQANSITPHMRAEAKSGVAEKILEEKKALEEITNEVRNEIERSLKKSETPHEEKSGEKTDFSRLIRIVTLAAAGILFFWIYSRFRKDEIKKVEGIPEELKEEIEEKLREVKRKKLSPREEVIETYNVLHDGLSGLVFVKETPPSCIVYLGMAAAEPELDKPLFTVTETFATTLYGENEVTTPMLKNFRKDIAKVFSFFDIRT